MKTRNMCFTALMTALLCTLGPLTVPVGPVPLSLATLAVYLSGALLGAEKGMLAVGMYLMLGASGMPVFSGFTSGVQALAGPTGGYLLGYAACAAVVGAAARRRLPLMAAMAAGTILCYAMGTAWFMAQTGVHIAGALVSCVFPFVPGDIMKMLAADAAVRAVKKGLAFR